MRLRGLVTRVVLVVVAVSWSACGSVPQTTELVTSGDCPGEEAAIREALDLSRLRVDVSGDGRLDTVAVASRPKAPEPCRAFVGVRVRGGSTYSTHLVPEAVPLKGLQARIAGLPSLGDRPGAEIVVDTRAAVDALLAQMFTLTDQALRAVRVPVFEDGTFIVEGGGVVYPHGAACTADGRMVLSRASQTRDGKFFRVVRRTYDVRGERARMVDPVLTRSTIPVDRLTARFPEFTGPHWRACTGTVLR